MYYMCILVDEGLISETCGVWWVIMGYRLCGVLCIMRDGSDMMEVFDRDIGI